MTPPPDSDTMQTPPRPPSQDATGSDLAALVGATPGMPDRREYLFFFMASVIVSMIISTLAGILIMQPLQKSLYQGVFQPENLRSALHLCGAWAPIAFILVQALQVMLMIWPVPLETASGALFGIPLGILYSTLGLALGSMLAFLTGRWLGKGALSRVISPDTMKIIRRLMRREGALAAFLIFLIPGLPKDVMCYIFGMTRMSLGFFLAASTLARLPNLILSVLSGIQMFKGNFAITWVISAIYLALAFLLYRHREAVYRWLRRFHHEED